MTRSRFRLAAAVALVAAIAVATIVVLGVGGARGGDGALRWAKDTRVIPSERPTDTILYGRVENSSLRDVDLDVRDVRVLDGEGRPVESAVRFLAAFVHGLYGASLKPPDPGDFERRRLGEIATIKPGQSVPITLSWRVPPGAPPPKRVDFGDIDLALP